MKTLEQLTELSKMYLVAYKQMNHRFDSWRNTVYPMVKEILQEIVQEINSQNEYFKDRLFIEGAKPDGSICLHSKFVMVQGAEYGTDEKGFAIYFKPKTNGKIHVYTHGHTLYGNAETTNIERIDDPLTITRDKIINMVYEAMDLAYKTSYLACDDIDCDIPF